MNETAPLQDWQQRVVAEQQELSDRIVKLDAFLKTQAFAALHSEDKSLLVRQLRTMRELDAILMQRLDRFRQ